ncbi:MAG: hypothetical protein HGB36_04720 [Chlorobiaceae bacterium]|nr:hypothetical protein [Chlorobiaceae bacterium]
MAIAGKETKDVINDIFTVAYRINGSIKTSNEVIYNAFRLIGSPEADQIEFFIKFIACRHERITS